MRQIKFRAKRMDSNEWLFGSLFVDEKEQCYIKEPDGKLYFIEDKDTIGQFTGLQDKNGKEVYEGDIIHVKEYDNVSDPKWSFEETKLFDLEELKGELRKDYISDIVWEDGEFVFGSEGDYKECTLAVLFGDMRLSFPIFDFEVTGNIHDDPDLLKQ